MTQSPNDFVVYGVAGDVARVNGERVMLWNACGRAIKAFYCVHHQQPLANRAQLEMHLEKSIEAHWVIAWCPAHGYEACEEAKQ